MSSPKGRTSQLKDDLQRCADSLKESADNFKTAVESIDPVLNELINVFLERPDGAQLEAGPVSGAQRLLTIKEVSDYLRVTERTIRTWIASGDIPHRKVQGEIRFDRKEVERWTKTGSQNQGCGW